MTELVERLRGEAALFEAGMNLDDGQTVDVLKEAADALSVLVGALEPFAKAWRRAQPERPWNGEPGRYEAYEAALHDAIGADDIERAAEAYEALSKAQGERE